MFKRVVTIAAALTAAFASVQGAAAWAPEHSAPMVGCYDQWYDVKTGYADPAGNGIYTLVVGAPGYVANWPGSDTSTIGGGGFSFTGDGGVLITPPTTIHTGGGPIYWAPKFAWWDGSAWQTRYAQSWLRTTTPGALGVWETWNGSGWYDLDSMHPYFGGSAETATKTFRVYRGTYWVGQDLYWAYADHRESEWNFTVRCG
jgi:hypothetical protein